MGRPPTHEGPLDGKPLPVLRTPRLRLRQLQEGDVPALFRVFGNHEVMRYWSSPPLANLEAARGLLGEIQRLFARRELFQWGVTQRDTGEVVGTCTLWRIDRAHRRAEIGFALGREFWGQGLMSEAVERVIRFAFQTLKLHRLEADADPRNARSLRLLQRQGFRREGVLRERYFVAGEAQDAVVLGLLLPDWRRRRETERAGRGLKGDRSGGPGRRQVAGGSTSIRTLRA